MDLDDIRMFVKVAELKSFVVAATDLRIQPSLLSRRIARLESSLGVRLLQRTTRSVSLTEEGERFFAETLLGLNQLHSAVEALHSLHGAPKGKVRVTSQIEIGQYLVEHVMPSFFLKYPEIDVEWDLLSVTKSMVESGIDLSIRSQRSNEQSLIEKKIGSLSIQLYSSPKFKTSLGKKITAEDLEKMPWIVFNRGPLENQASKIIINIDGVGKEIRPKNVRFKTNSLMSVRHAIAQGIGIGLLPSPLADSEVLNGRLLPVLPRHISANKIDFYATYPSREYLAPKIRVLIDWLSENFPTHSASSPK